MRQLHVVALSQDGKSLLLAGTARSKKPTHRIALDAKLKSALRPERNGATAQADGQRRESALTPREMQARLRAGASVAEVAKLAGVPADRVERFFAPVESERIQILDSAQTATMERPRWGESARSLGESVAVNLGAVSSLRAETVTWSARRRADGYWVVRVDFIARARRRAAEWEWSPHEHTLFPLDSLATSLGYVEPRGGAIRRRSRTTSGSATRRAATAKRAATRKGKRTAKTAVTKKTAKKSVKGSTARTTKRAAKRTTKRSSKTSAGKKVAAKAAKKRAGKTLRATGRSRSSRRQ